ncbi:Protein of unknown function [Gryllus bimaculatus]|nr:Protein of unknown function [Gryllus bimaculatus]
MERALQRLRDSGGSLSHLDDDSLAHLPVTFLTHWAAREVPHVYIRLPLHIQQLSSIQELLPCLEHYNEPHAHRRTATRQARLLLLPTPKSRTF